MDRGGGGSPQQSPRPPAVATRLAPPSRRTARPPPRRRPRGQVSNPSFRRDRITRRPDWRPDPARRAEWRPDPGAGDGRAGARGRVDRRVRWRDGPSRARDPARRPADDDRPRVRSGAGPARRRPGRALVAPARIAAYEPPVALAAGRPDPPTA